MLTSQLIKSLEDGLIGFFYSIQSRIVHGYLISFISGWVNILSLLLPTNPLYTAFYHQIQATTLGPEY